MRASLLSSLRRLFAPRCPEGEPAILRDIRARFPDGLTFEPLPICALCQQKLDKAEDKQQAARDIQRAAQRPDAPFLGGDHSAEGKSQ